MIIAMAEHLPAVADDDDADRSQPRCGREGAATISDSTAAWLLLEEAKPCLTADQRTLVFVELGCGEHHLAVERILKASAGKRFALSADVLTMLKTWLTPYVGSLEERRLRLLLGAVEPK
jgi:hypothetical protein